MASKCPHCEERLTTVNVEPMKLTRKTGSKINGVSYFCPHCQSALSVSVDPAAVVSEIVKEISRR